MGLVHGVVGRVRGVFFTADAKLANPRADNARAAPTHART